MKKQSSITTLILAAASCVLLAFFTCDEPASPPLPVPATPAIDSIVPGNGTNTVYWGAIEGAANYAVRWDTVAGFAEGANTVPGLIVTQLVHSGLINGLTYYYRVAAVSSQGPISRLSLEKSGTPFADTLAVPQNVSATPGDSLVKLTWERSDGASSYSIYWAIDSGVTDRASSISGIAQLSYVHSGLVNGTAHYYRLAARGTGNVSSGLSKEVSAIPIAATLDAPIVTATAGDGMVTLSWKGGGKGTTYTYTVYWGLAAGITRQSDSIPDLTKAAYTHTGLTNGVAYYYRVSAKDAAGLISALSEEVSAMPDTTASADAPTNVTATAGVGQVVISWTTNTTYDHYIFYATTSPVTSKSNLIYNEQGGTKKALATKKAQGKGLTSPFTHTGLTSGVTHYYKVAAYIAATASWALSEEVSATPN